MSRLNILYQSDDNYAVFMGVSICSLLENNKAAESINIYVIDDSIGAQNKEMLSAMVCTYGRNLIFLSSAEILSRREITEPFAYKGMRKNVHSYLKLFLSELLPELHGKILYIDCDTAVIDDLSGLLSINMEGKALGMVIDSLITADKAPIDGLKCRKYYNSGVMLVDLDRWRQQHCPERILNHARTVRTYGTVDQDLLNAVLGNETMTLPVRYNLQPIHLDYPYREYIKVFKHKEVYYTKEEIDEAVESPGIIHYLRYIGEYPWHAGNVHPGTLYFDRYLEMTPWKGYQKKASGKGALYKVEKWMFRYLPGGIFLRLFQIVHQGMIAKSNRKGKRG